MILNGIATGQKLSEKKLKHWVQDYQDQQDLTKVNDIAEKYAKLAQGVDRFTSQNQFTYIEIRAISLI